MKHIFIISVISLLTLQACGVKPNEVIPERETDFPRTYPSE